MRREDRWQNKPQTDKTGQKFGLLTVTGFSHYELKNGKQKGRKLIWDCICECGTIKKVENSNLISGSVRSCGCLSKERLKQLHAGNVKEDIAFKYVMREYIRSAKERNYEFELTEEQFKTITQMNCFYCGIEPKQIKNKNGSHSFKNSVYVYNGIDRKNNLMGYIFENCVPCCKECNIAKAQMSIDEFLLWNTRVFEFNKRKEK